MSADAPTTGPDESRRSSEPSEQEAVESTSSVPEPAADTSARISEQQPAPAVTDTGPTEPAVPTESVEPTGPAEHGPEPVQPDPADDVVPPAVPAESATDRSEPQPTPAVAPATETHAPDQTHVAAVAAQTGDDPFSEVDGGESPAEPAAVPTADEDAALRDERARRFGRPVAADPDAADPDEEPTTTLQETERDPSPAPAAVPLAAAGAGSVATVGATSASTDTRTLPAETSARTGSGEEDPFKDFDDGPVSRAAAHWWSILITIVFTPVAWYLIADGGERMSFNLSNGGPLNLAGPLELAAGALCLFFVLLAARWSSVGAILVGSVAALLGIGFIAFNEEAMELVAEYQGTVVQALNQLGQNIVDHILADAQSGRLAVYGLVLIMAGVISHGARRQGRREERRKAAIGG